MVIVMRQKQQSKLYRFQQKCRGQRRFQELRTSNVIFVSKDVEVAAIYRLQFSLSVIYEAIQLTSFLPGNPLRDSESKSSCHACCDNNGAPRTFATETGSEVRPESVPRVQHEPCNHASMPEKRWGIVDWIGNELFSHRLMFSTSSNIRCGDDFLLMKEKLNHLTLNEDEVVTISSIVYFDFLDHKGWYKCVTARGF